MRSRGNGSIPVLVSAGLLSNAATGALAAEQSVDVALDPAIECRYQDAFPELLARFEPGAVERSRLNFRCSLYADDYFVDLEAMPDGDYRGIGPMAEESCPSVT